MVIAELFVELGVKGADVAGKAFSGVKTGLGEIASSGLVAKASILGVLYGLERLTQAESERGMALKQFSDLTGLSTDRLQRWQYAARQSGVSAEEMAGSIKGVQNAMTNMLMGKGTPEGFGVLARSVGFDMNKARDTFYVMDKLREYAQKAPPDMGNQILKSFGLSEGTIQMLRTSKVELDKIRPSALYSSGEISQLANINVAWSNLWNTMRMFSGHLIAQHGMSGIKMLSDAFKFLSSTTVDLVKLTQQFPALQAAAVAAAVAIGAAFAPVTTAIAGTIFLLSELQKQKEGKETKVNSLMQYLSGNEIGKDLSSGFNKLMGNEEAAVPSGAKKSIFAPNEPSSESNFNITQNFQHDGQNAAKLADATKQGIKAAVVQMPARRQVN